MSEVSTDCQTGASNAVPESRLAARETDEPGAGVVTADSTSRLLWNRYTPMDVIVAIYTGWVAILAGIYRENIAEPGKLIAFHLFVLVAMILVPPRGAAWEQARAEDPAWRRYLRGGLRFFRYSYPLLLILFYFEEVAHTVNAIYLLSPHWFEPYLYVADRWLFGELPSIFMNGWVGYWQDEILHGFYFSYYFILIGGVVLAWFGSKGSRQPAPGFETTLTTAILAFFLAFVWYPFLPARGPWENPELMARMIPFRGVVFTPIIERIIDHGAVSGGCFPSSHVAGSWGIVFGLARYQRKAAMLLGLVAIGLSLSCVYTRYHHGVDIPAGFLAALVAAFVGWSLTPGPATKPPAAWRSTSSNPEMW